MSQFKEWLDAWHTAQDLDPFSEDNPQLWFQQLEVIFNIHGIRDDQGKLDIIIGLSPYNVLKMVMASLPNIPEQTTYNDYKETVINHYTSVLRSNVQPSNDPSGSSTENDSRFAALSLDKSAEETNK